MSIFDLHTGVVRDYEHYVQSFLSIADDRIRDFVEHKLLRENVFWPDALVQLNPSYELVQTIDDLAELGTLTPATAAIFRTSSGAPLRLYRHQCEAIERAAKRESFVVTSGDRIWEEPYLFHPDFRFSAAERCNGKHCQGNRHLSNERAR